MKRSLVPVLDPVRPGQKQKSLLLHCKFTIMFWIYGLGLTARLRADCRPNNAECNADADVTSIEFRFMKAFGLLFFCDFCVNDFIIFDLIWWATWMKLRRASAALLDILWCCVIPNSNINRAMHLVDNRICVLNIVGHRA